MILEIWMILMIYVIQNVPLILPKDNGELLVYGTMLYILGYRHLRTNSYKHLHWL